MNSHEILGRDGKFVVRPDSPRFGGDSPSDQVIWIAQELASAFGSTTNSKGYEVLDPHVGIIYGDGVDADDIMQTVDDLMDNDFAPETCVFGMGGGLLQKHNRDTQRSAFKCSAQKRNGEWHDVHKTTLTKASKAGKLKLVRDNGKYTTVPINSPGADVLETVFIDGHALLWTWDEVCARKTMS